MAKNSSPRWHVAPLQRVVAEEITDPAERAALDALRRRFRQNGESLTAEDANGAVLHQAGARLLELSRQLPPHEVSALLARLGAELPAEQQFELLARVLAHISPEALGPLEGELTALVGARSE